MGYFPGRESLMRMKNCDWLTWESERVVVVEKISMVEKRVMKG